MRSNQSQGNLSTERSSGGVPDLRELVESVRLQTCAWLDSLAPHDLERQQVERLHTLTESLLVGEVIPLVALEQVRKQICDVCRRLNAGRNYSDCKGRALGYCPILIERAGD